MTSMTTRSGGRSDKTGVSEFRATQMHDIEFYLVPEFRRAGMGDYLRKPGIDVLSPRFGEYNCTKKFFINLLGVVTVLSLFRLGRRQKF